LNESTQVFTGQNWDAQVLRAEGPVLVDFWAAWCPPCRKIGPLVDELAREYAGRVRVGKLDVDYSPDVAVRYDIVSIPTLVLFRDGRVVEKRVGALPREELRRLLEIHAGEKATASG
jgi:thioredoxin 1